MWALNLLSSLIGIGTGLASGNQAAAQNAQTQGKIDGLLGNQQSAIGSMTGYAAPMQGLINQQQQALGGYGQLSGGLGNILAQYGSWGGSDGGSYPGNLGMTGQPSTGSGGFGGLSPLQNGFSLSSLMNGVPSGTPLAPGQGIFSGLGGGTAGQAGGVFGLGGGQAGGSRYGGNGITNMLGSAAGTISGALPGMGGGQPATGGQGTGLMGQLAQLYSNAAGQRPVMASDNGAGGALMANAGNVLNATNPDAYRRQAELAGNQALGQLNAQMAARGVNGGGSARLGAQTLAGLYADSAAKGNADRLQAYGLSNQALGQAGQLGLNQSQLQNGMNNDHFSLLSNLLNQRSQFMGQQAGLLGQQGGLLNNYMTGLGNMSGQYGNIANLYGNAANMYGNAANGMQSQINQNPYGGMGASLGSLGNIMGALFGLKT